jgi:hypothetical protein
MNNLALGELCLAYEQRHRDLRQALTSGTGLRILQATAAAKLRWGSPSLADIAAEGDLPIGTVKATRSRTEGLREAMEEVGQGPTEDDPLEIATIDSEFGDPTPWEALARSEQAWWQNRGPVQQQAWIEAVGCFEGFHSYEAEVDREEIWGEELKEGIYSRVPAVEQFRRLWGDHAWFHIGVIDSNHRMVTGPVPLWASDYVEAVG